MLLEGPHLSPVGCLLEWLSAAMRLDDLQGGDGSSDGPRAWRPSGRDLVVAYAVSFPIVSYAVSVSVLGGVGMFVLTIVFFWAITAAR